MSLHYLSKCLFLIHVNWLDQIIHNKKKFTISCIRKNLRKKYNENSTYFGNRCYDTLGSKWQQLFCHLAVSILCVSRVPLLANLQSTIWEIFSDIHYMSWYYYILYTPEQLWVGSFRTVVASLAPRVFLLSCWVVDTFQ